MMKKIIYVKNIIKNIFLIVKFEERMCLICEQEHSEEEEADGERHDTIGFSKLLPKMNKVKDNNKELKEKINKF